MSADESCTSLNGKYTTALGNEYTVNCQYDHYGGDFGNASASTFTQCFSICDSTPGCDGFSYHPSLDTCYMKALPFSSGDFNADSDWAQKAIAVSSSLSTSASSTAVPSTASSVLQSVTSTLQSDSSAASSSLSTTPTSSLSFTTVSTGTTSTTAASSTSASESAASVQPPSSGFTMDQKIALGVGLGVGLPSLLIAVLTYLGMRQTKPAEIR